MATTLATGWSTGALEHSFVCLINKSIYVKNFEIIIHTNLVCKTYDFLIISFQVGEDSGKCRSCGAKMSAYFCAICKHFTSMGKNPYHCEKCGICR